MADFYKGYFEDRYSFAHSDKKWYAKHKQDVKEYNHNYYEAHKKVDTKNRFYKGSTYDMNQNPSKHEIEKMETGTIYTQDGKYCVKYENTEHGVTYGIADNLKDATIMSKNAVRVKAEQEAREKDKRVQEAAERINSLVSVGRRGRPEPDFIVERVQRMAFDRAMDQRKRRV